MQTQTEQLATFEPTDNSRRDQVGGSEDRTQSSDARGLGRRASTSNAFGVVPGGSEDFVAQGNAVRGPAAMDIIPSAPPETYEALLEEHRSLVMRSFEDDFSVREKRQLGLVRWRLDQIRDERRRHRPVNGSLRELVEAQQSLAQEVARFGAEVEAIRQQKPRPRRRKNPHR